jgi:sulfur dioxygenase
VALLRQVEAGEWPAALWAEMVELGLPRALVPEAASGVGLSWGSALMTLPREAVLIDPVLETAERDATLARELGLRLTTVLNTHVHADHVSGASRLRGLVPGLLSMTGAGSGAVGDGCLADGSLVRFGARALRVIATPGHTAGCVSFVLDDQSAVFTGDTLLVRGCGRTDFQDGSSRVLYNSITRKLFAALPRACVVYPAHDYNGFTSTTIGEEADFNPRAGVGRSADEFDRIMAALKLAKPVHIDVAVPANLRDGILAGAPPASGVVPPDDCLVCRQDGGPAIVPCVW